MRRKWDTQQLMMSLKRQHTMDDVEHIVDNNDNANDNDFSKKRPFIKASSNHRMISREMSVDILDESSSSLLMVDTGNDPLSQVAVAVVMGDFNDDFSDDDATTVHGGDDELLPLENETVDDTKLTAVNANQVIILKIFTFY